MYKVPIETLKMFIVANCAKCKMRHAPIRDCIDSEGNKMYFDAVINDKDLTVAYNGTPADTKAYLERMSMDRRDAVHVMEGWSLNKYSVEQYLAK